jgi:uncharacterized protein YndB with AHSA1/START domain/uncharacterized protein YciI
MEDVSPIRHEIVVPATPEQAFAVFTEDIAGWWPLDRMNVLGGTSLVSFEEDHRLVEATLDGVEAVWAEAEAWEPGRRLSLIWHPGTDAVSTLTLTFTATEDGTSVELGHSGWDTDTDSDPETTRADYDLGWPMVLAAYGAQFGPPAADSQLFPGDASSDTWVALMHTPGPAAPTNTSVFGDPRFGEHLAFLQRMSKRGYLIAAGPLGTEGSSMTILRLPGEDGLAKAELASTDDVAVASGLLTVSVRPWNVILHGPG